MGKLGTEGFLKLLLALIFAGVLYNGGTVAYKHLQTKTASQIAVNESIERWKQSYKSLQTVSVEWKNKYKPASSVPDIRTLIALIDLPSVGLESDTDNLILVSVDQVQQENFNIGLTKICLGTTSNELVVRSTSYTGLLSAINKLGKREDISIGSIKVESVLHKQPQAKLGQFCIFLRNE